MYVNRLLRRCKGHISYFTVIVMSIKRRFYFFCVFCFSPNISNISDPAFCDTEFVSLCVLTVKFDSYPSLYGLHSQPLVSELSKDYSCRYMTRKVIVNNAYYMLFLYIQIRKTSRYMRYKRHRIINVYTTNRKTERFGGKINKLNAISTSN